MVFAALCLGAVLASLWVLPASGGDEAYLLREWDGYIGVFFPADADRPASVTGIRVADLPPGDRIELRAGVTATDRAAVVRLLEDYGS